MEYWAVRSNTYPLSAMAVWPDGQTAVSVSRRPLAIFLMFE